MIFSILQVARDRKNC